LLLASQLHDDLHKGRKLSRRRGEREALDWL
jgi:hypothetical protein